MILTEPIDTLNTRLKDHYGMHDSLRPIYRIVHSDTELTKQLGDFEDRTPEGFLIRRVTEVREFPKYSWIHNKHILERLTVVPYMHIAEMLGEQLTYEPVWVFEDGAKNPLPPKWEVIELVIDTIHRTMARAVGVQYKDPDSIPEEAIENKRKQISNLQAELFGNETEVGDALKYKEGIVVPHNFQSTQES